MSNTWRVHQGTRGLGKPLTPAIIALLFALAGGALTACDGQPPIRGITPGSQIAARTAIEPTDVRAKVFLPTGKLVFRSGEPLTRLEASQTRDHEALDAPEGGSFLPLRWVFHTKLFEGVQDVFGSPRTLSMSLVADGEEYGLAPPRMDAAGEAVSNLYVAVDGDPSELQLNVEYAGVTQKVDLVTGKVRPGRARLMSRAAEVVDKAPSECESARWVDFEDPLRHASFGCRHTRAMVTPYIAGKFVKAGYAFVVMRITTNFPNYILQDGEGGQAVYGVQSSEDRTTMDGRRPIKVLGKVEHVGAHDGWYAWRVELDARGEPKFPDNVRFARHYRLKLGQLRGDWDPANRISLTIAGKIPLSE